MIYNWINCYHWQCSQQNSAENRELYLTARTSVTLSEGSFRLIDHKIFEGMTGKYLLNCGQMIYEMLIKIQYLPCDLNRVL